MTRVIGLGSGHVIRAGSHFSAMMESHVYNNEGREEVISGLFIGTKDGFEEA